MMYTQFHIRWNTSSFWRIISRYIQVHKFYLNTYSVTCLWHTQFLSHQSPFTIFFRLFYVARLYFHHKHNHQHLTKTIICLCTKANKPTILQSNISEVNNIYSIYLPTQHSYDQPDLNLLCSSTSEYVLDDLNQIPWFKLTFAKCKKQI